MPPPGSARRQVREQIVRAPTIEQERAAGQQAVEVQRHAIAVVYVHERTAGERKRGVTAMGFYVNVVYCRTTGNH